jgi:Met-zincin/Domain of unknown function (DUF5117)/Domain of unknown function (DUF5118)
MKRFPFACRFALGLAALAWACPFSPAKIVAAEEPAPPAEKAKPDTKDAKPKKPEKKPDFPPFKEVTEDFEKREGFFDLYYNDKKNELLAVIPKSMIGKDFLILSSLSGGPSLAGFMWQPFVARWEEMDKKLVLIEPDLSHSEVKGKPISDVIRRTYTDRIVLSTKIVSKRGGDPVVSFDDVFKSDRVGLGRLYGGSVNKSLSQWAKVKAFEKNVELSIDVAVMGKRKTGIHAGVHYSISELPKNDYKARVADDRIGYFMTAVKDYGRDHSDPTLFDRLIHRWHFRKADPSAALSDVHPDDQLVFYLEKTIPVKFRRYVREGVLMWNDAFEKAGLLNAVAVRQQTDDNEWKDLDPEDVRYNFIRWIVSGRAFAMGPSRVNPRTGQILDADILIDDSFMRAIYAQYARLNARGPSAAYDPQLHEFLANNPEWAYQPLEEQILPEYTSYGGADMSWDPDILNDLVKNHQFHCTYATGLAHEFAFANFLSSSVGHGQLSDKYIGQFIKWVVSHEVGHTLGLRHNFKASTWKPLDEILATEGDKDVPTSASVMDYCPAMFALTPDDQKNFYGVGLGPYDLWAIEYGYRHTDDEHSTEKDLLSSIASRSAESGHAYGTDEDRGFFSPDPLVNVYDNSDDPIAYATYRMGLVKKLQSNMLDWAIEDGESYSRLRRAFDGLLFEYSRVTSFAARFIGGQYVNRHHKGDPDAKPPLEIVPPAKQREALDFLVENVFSDHGYKFDPELINRLGPGRWGHWDSDDYDTSRDYPLHDRIAATRFLTLFHLTNPFTLTRIHDAELKTPADQDAMTLPEVMGKTTDAIWSELDDNRDEKWTPRNPKISSLRRNLQRTHLRLMLNIIKAEPGRTMPADAHAVARMTLKNLADKMQVALGGPSTFDIATRAHLDEAMTRITRALDADFKL